MRRIQSTAPVLLLLLGSLVLVACGPTPEQKLEAQRVIEERDDLAAQVVKMQTEHDRALADGARLAAELRVAQETLASISVDASAAETESGRNTATMIELNTKLGVEIAALRGELVEARQLNEKYLKVERGELRETLVGTDLGSWAVGGFTYDEARITGLTPAWIEVSHTGGKEKFLLERLSEEDQARFGYHLEDAEAYQIEMRKKREEEILLEKEAERQAEVAAKARVDAAKRAELDKVRAVKLRKVREIQQLISDKQIVVRSEANKVRQAKAQGKAVTVSSISKRAKDDIDRYSQDLDRVAADLRAFEVEHGYPDSLVKEKKGE